MLSAIRELDIELQIEYYIEDGHVIIKDYADIREQIEQRIEHFYGEFIGDFKEQNSDSRY